MSLGFNNTPPVRFEGPRPDVVSAPRFFFGGDPDFPSGCRANNSRFLQQKTMSTEDRINQGVAHASPSFDYRNGVRSVRVCRLWGGTAPRVITMRKHPRDSCQSCVRRQYPGDLRPSRVFGGELSWVCEFRSLDSHEWCFARKSRRRDILIRIPQDPGRRWRRREQLPSDEVGRYPVSRAPNATGARRAG